MKPACRKIASLALLALFLGGFLWGCASPGPMFYSLDDPEVFRVEQGHPFKLLVVRLVDRRPPSELEWENRVTGGKPDFVERVTERLGMHLAESGLFREVRITLDRIEPGSLIHNREFTREGIDLVLEGELAHFSGASDADGNIAGRAAFENLRLIHFRTGNLLWEGSSDKTLKRKEKEVRPGTYYASEALRGALNRATQSIAGLELSELEGIGAVSPKTTPLKVGIMIPEDKRPEEEKDILLRRLKGDPYYSFYAGSSFWAKFLCGGFNKCDFPTREDLNPLPDQIALAWVARLEERHLFSEVELIRSQSIKPGSLERWKNMGYGAVLSSRLTHSFGAVTPSSEAEWFPLWSGGVAIQKKFKAFSVTRIDQARLIDTGTGSVLWEGDGQFSFERAFYGWRIPSGFLWFSIRGALDQLTADLENAVISGNLKGFSSE